MKKIISSSVLVGSLFCTNLSAVSIEDRITSLENEIKSLQATKEHIEGMDGRLESVEIRTLVDKISLGHSMNILF